MYSVVCRGVPLGMHRMSPGYFEANFVYRSLAADVPLREEPDEDDDEEEDSNNQEGDDEYDGYSE